MKKLIVVVAVIYGLVAVSIGLLHGIDLWDSPVSVNLVKEALSTGLLWPVAFVQWIG